jgi:tRNA pseudouridine32 synthase / 23S rRNA pseudouridine746 synthase
MASFWVAASHCVLLAMTPLNRSTVALPGDIRVWQTLLDFFVEKFPHISRDVWQRRFHDGEIRYHVVGAACRDQAAQRHDVVCSPSRRGEPLLQEAIAHATDPPRAHVKLTYLRHFENEIVIPFEERIVFEDDYALIADKPHFLPVVPSGSYAKETLLARLQAKTKNAALSPAHRIDRETAGLVLFTKHVKDRGAFQSLFREHRIEKIYEAIVPWSDDSTLPFTYRSRLVRSENFMQATTVEGKPNAETRIELLEKFEYENRGFAHLRLLPRTGVRHQLRAQLAALGMPIEGDRIYPTLLPHAPQDFSNPLQLVARSLRFVHPLTSQPIIVHSSFALQRFTDELIDCRS